MDSKTTDSFIQGDQEQVDSSTTELVSDPKEESEDKPELEEGQDEDKKEDIETKYEATPTKKKSSRKRPAGKSSAAKSPRSSK